MATSEDPIAQRVASNVRRLRQAQDLTQGDLCERLDDHGRPLGLTTLSKIELGQRGVDVDDLVALAAVLEVPVAVLLADPVEQMYATAMARVELFGLALRRNIEARVQAAEDDERAWADLVRWAAASGDHRDQVAGALVATIGGSWGPRLVEELDERLTTTDD